MTDVLPEWHVAVDGCTNFRDAGGWPTDDGGTMRRGRLYRSDEPVRLTPRGRDTVRGLGIRFVVDVRQYSQFGRGPGFLPPEHTAHVPLVDRVIDPANPPTLRTAPDMTELYVEMLSRGREQLGRALDLIAAHVAEGPVLVHCVYGKDRAGLVTALVQAAIGVTGHSIVADYTRSHAPAQRRRAWMVAEPLPDDPKSGTVSDVLFTAPAQAMHLLLERVRAEYGSLGDWARSLPIAATTIPALRDALVER